MEANNYCRHSRESGNLGLKQFFEFRLKAWIPAFAGMTLLLLPGLVHSEATKEYTRDAGIYSANPFSIFTFSFSSINVDFDSTSDPNPPEGLKVASTTVATQWGGWGIFNTTAMGNNVVTDLNFSDYVNGHLRFWLKSQIALDVKIEYQQGSNAVQVSSSVASTGNAWKEIVIPLQSGGFGLNNGQMNRIRSPFIVVAPQTTGVQKQWFIDHVRWTKPVTSIVMYPPSTTVQQGFHRLFTAEGRDAANERVIIYPTFSVSPTVGTFTPADPTPVTASRLNATGASGVANAVFSPLSASSVVTITGSHINDELGLLSETIPSSLILNTDSELDVSSGGGGTDPVLLDESSSDVREGVRRFKTTISAQPANGFSGWFIQWSTNAANTVTRDMSNYYDGSLRFWFKGPAALQNVLQISVRSGNTEAGTELSKVNLKNYVTFDDTWRPVVIPISDFTGARPKADLSRMKILFGAFAVGAVGSVQTFYIDNLRWDTNIPGALASLTVSPASVTVPLSAKRQFVAKGFDANGVSVDIFPTWTITGGIGSVNPSQGAITQLTAASSAQSGTLKASQGAVSATASVNVADVQWVQSFNVYSDNGSGGFVGVAKGTNNGTVMNLSEQNLGAGVAPEGKFVRQSNYTLVNNPNLQDAFAIWFTNADAGTGSRFMHYFDTGYLYFWVRTTQDLQISIRSANITAGNERSKFRLSELGVPLDNNWQKVVIALADFKNREPLLDFDQIQTYFAIGAVSSQIGPVTNQTFDVDDVKWLTNNPGQPDDNKIYIGLKEKQAAGGLVRSFDTLLDAYTYDQALAAMNYTYRKDVALSKKVFDVYKYVHDNYGGTFSGFHEDYNINSAVGGYTVLNSSRVAGPNAWILLAMIHYRNVTGSTAYDTVINDVAAWLRGLQGADGAVQFGRVNSTLITLKSTEHNFDVVAAFRAYAKMSGNSAYNSYADAARNWLQTQMYVPAQQRFNVGTYANGTTNTDRALDAYSWAPLALSSFTNVLTTAETDFKNTKVCDLTGLSVTGFDFSGPPNFGPDLDAVWLEGTGQMALAYYLTDNLAKGDFYLQELDKAIVNTSANGQGMAYATNNGTAYGFNMNSLNPAISSMAWYLFAKQKFNPFKPYPIYELKIMDTASGTERSSVGFTVSVPAAWVRADQYIKLDVQPNSVDPWGLQILTDNTQPTVVPRFVDPTPGTTSNSDSNPAGLLLELTGQTTTPYQINMAWSVKDTSATATMPIATDPNSGAPNSFQWIFMKDRATPDIPSMNTVAFANGQDDVIVRKAVSGSHTSQGPAGYTASVSPDYLFLEANFNSAAAPGPLLSAYHVRIFPAMILDPSPISASDRKLKHPSAEKKSGRREKVGFALLILLAFVGSFGIWRWEPKWAKPSVPPVEKPLVRLPVPDTIDERHREHIKNVLSVIESNINPETYLAYSFSGDKRLEYWSVVYDNCIRAIVHLQTGQPELAKKIIDYFIDNTAIQKIGWVRKNHRLVARTGWVINIVDASESRAGGRGIEHIAHTGPNAYLGIAALHIFEVTGEQKYLRFAKKQWELLKDLQNEDPQDPNFGGIRMGPMGNPANPREQRLDFKPSNPSFYEFYNGEHAADFKAFSELLSVYDLENQERYEKAVDLIETWDHRIYDAEKHLFYIGTTEKKFFDPNIGQWISVGVIPMYPLDTSSLKISAYGVDGLEQFEKNAAQKIRKAIDDNFKVTVRIPDGSGGFKSVSGYDFVCNSDRARLIRFVEMGHYGDRKINEGIGREPLLSDEWSNWVALADLRLTADFEKKNDNRKATMYSNAYYENALVSSMKTSMSVDGGLAYPYAQPLPDSLNKPVGFGWNTHHEPYAIIGGAARILGILRFDPFLARGGDRSTTVNVEVKKLGRPIGEMRDKAVLYTEAELYLRDAWRDLRVAQINGPKAELYWSCARATCERMLREHQDWVDVAMSQNNSLRLSRQPFPLTGVANLTERDLEPVYRKYWALYHIGTAEFILVVANAGLRDIYRERGDVGRADALNLKAIEAAKRIKKDFCFAQSYDEGGWLWQPAQAINEYVDLAGPINH